MAQSNEVQIIPAKKTLSAKVTRTATDSSTMIDRAEAEVAKLQEDYPTWTQGYLDDLAAAAAALQAESGGQEPHLRKIFGIAHDMKGHGGSFGYGMVTEIADSLCRFVEKIDTAHEREIEVIEAHLGGLKTVVHNRIKGDGGDLGRQLTASLRAATKKAGG